MPFSTAELEAWVGTLGLSEEDKKSVLGALSKGETLTKVGSSILTQQDFSRKMNELSAEKQKLEQEFKNRQAEEDRFHAGLGKWKTDKETEFSTKLKEATDQAETRLQAASAKIKELAARNGISEDEIKDIIPASAPVTRQDPPRDPDTGKYLPRDEWNREAQAYVKLPAIMVGLDREYYRLFGNDAPPVNWEKVIEDATANKRSVSAQFEETFKMSDKRKEIETAARKKELEDAEKRGEERANSKLYQEHPELANRTVNRERPGSPILTEARRQAAAGKPPDKATGGPRSAVEAAVKAFQEGKYKDGVEHAA